MRVRPRKKFRKHHCSWRFATEFDWSYEKIVKKCRVIILSTRCAGQTWNDEYATSVAARKVRIDVTRPSRRVESTAGVKTWTSPESAAEYRIILYYLAHCAADARKWRVRRRVVRYASDVETVRLTDSSCRRVGGVDRARPTGFEFESKNFVKALWRGHL